MKFKTVMACVAIVALTPSCKGASGENVGQKSQMEVLDVKVTSAKGGVHVFKAEVAATPEDQQRGLMFREGLSPNAGMLFPMNPPRMASFWMKNTPISLDMIFIRKDGTIARIAAETIPYSLEQSESGEPVAAVLEISGGRAAQLGIAENDKVSW